MSAVSEKTMSIDFGSYFMVNTKVNQIQSSESEKSTRAAPTMILWVATLLSVQSNRVECDFTNSPLSPAVKKQLCK